MQITKIHFLQPGSFWMNLHKPKLKDAQKIQQQIGGRRRCPGFRNWAWHFKDGAGCSKFWQGARGYLDGCRRGRQAARRA